MTLITCSECNKTVSDKASSCVHCGAPLEPKTSVSTYFIGALVVIGIVSFTIWNYFIKSEVEVVDFQMEMSFINNRSITFTLENIGPSKNYDFYVAVGNNIGERLLSDKYCPGTISLGKNETKSFEYECPDLNFTFSKYSLIVN
mgnify:CR=1 FL=1